MKDGFDEIHSLRTMFSHDSSFAAVVRQFCDVVDEGLSHCDAETQRRSVEKIRILISLLGKAKRPDSTLLDQQNVSSAFDDLKTFITGREWRQS